MTLYAQTSEYQEVYSDIDAKEAEKYLELASITVNLATLTRIERIGFQNLTTLQQELIKKATIEGAHYFKENAIFECEELESYSITDISAKEKETIASALNLPKVAFMYLKRTGLTSRII